MGVTTDNENQARFKSSKLDKDSTRKKFFKALVLTGNPTNAAKAVNLGRSACYNYRSKNEAFREGWEEAMEMFIDNAEATLADRAINGVKEPVFFRGNICGYIIRYSDGNLQKFLAANRKKYRAQQDVNVHVLDGLADRMAKADTRLGVVRKPEALPEPSPEEYNIIDVDAEDLVDITPEEEATENM